MKRHVPVISRAAFPSDNFDDTKKYSGWACPWWFYLYEDGTTLTRVTNPRWLYKDNSGTSSVYVEISPADGIVAYANIYDERYFKHFGSPNWWATTYLRRCKIKRRVL